METQKDRATEYREIAAGCIEVAKRVSSKADQNHMTAMAERYLELAKEAERR